MRVIVPFFVSYAHLDERLAGDCVARFRMQARPSRRYDYRLWRDDAILPGERWRQEIEGALDVCRVGLLLVSPAFLASEFITGIELPRFVGAEARPVIPVVLKPVDLERHDLRGLEDHQHFRLDGGRSFADCRAARDRDRFVEQLFDRVERRLDRIMAHV